MPEHGHTIMSPCEPDGLNELKLKLSQAMSNMEEEIRCVLMIYDDN